MTMTGRATKVISTSGPRDPVHEVERRVRATELDIGHVSA